MSWATLFSYLPQLLSGVVITLELMILSLIFGFMLAIGLVIAQRSHHKIWQWLAHAYVTFIRGTPLLIQIYLIYYGSGQLTWLRDTPIWQILREPFACAVIALTLNSAAYTSVLFAGALRAIPAGERIACQALGMSSLLAFRRILMPHALRLALPAYSNEVIIILKSTSLASTITLMDLMGVTNRIIAETYEALPFLLMAGALYLILNGGIVALFRGLERRYQTR